MLVANAAPSLGNSAAFATNMGEFDPGGRVRNARAALNACIFVKWPGEGLGKYGTTLLRALKEVDVFSFWGHSHPVDGAAVALLPLNSSLPIFKSWLASSRDWAEELGGRKSGSVEDASNKRCHFAFLMGCRTNTPSSIGEAMKCSVENVLGTTRLMNYTLAAEYSDLFWEEFGSRRRRIDEASMWNCAVAARNSFWNEHEEGFWDLTARWWMLQRSEELTVGGVFLRLNHYELP